MSTARLGWIDFSEQDLRAARRMLAAESDGVRDELGLLAIHSGYAERFFPGTSVLQTRLRYALFVPWMYQRIADRGGRVERDLPAAELALATALNATYQGGADSDGIIGVTLVARGESPAQPPSFVFWTALRTWDLFKLPLSRSEFHRRFDALNKPRKASKDDDGQLVDPAPAVWRRMPEAPDDFPANASFALTDEERTFLRERLMHRQPCLLQRLAELRMAPGRAPFHDNDDVREAAVGEDGARLVRAGHAARFVAIVRAVYNALVEQALGARGPHFDRLTDVLAAYQRDARTLNLAALATDVPGLEGKLVDVLEAVRHAAIDARSADDLLTRSVAAAVERRESRKGMRARLGTLPFHDANRKRWEPAGTGPVEYRWFRVQRMLADLAGAANG